MLQYDLIEVAMRAKRLGRILEALLVGAHVAALASIDPSDRLVERVAIKVVDRRLLNLRNLRIAEQYLAAELDRDHPRIGLVEEVIALGGQLLYLLGQRVDLRVERLDLILHRLQIGLGPVGDDIFLRQLRVQFVDFLLVRSRIFLVLNGVVVVVPSLGQVRLGEPHQLILVVRSIVEIDQLPAQIRELGGSGARVELLLRLGQVLRYFLIGGIGVEPLLLVSRILHVLVVRQMVPLNLILLPRTARDVVVPDRPDRADQQHRYQQHEQRAVRLPFFGGIKPRSASHLLYLPSAPKMPPRGHRPILSRIVSSHLSARYPHALDDVAGQKNQDADPGELVFVAHPVRLGDADIKREPDVGESERLQYFGEDEHGVVAATSDVNPRRNQDVLDVERVPQCHLDEHSRHRDQQKSRDAEAHRSPLRQDLGTATGKRGPRISRGPRSYPEIQDGVTYDEVAPYEEQAEQRRCQVVAEPEHVRQVDVGQRLDQVRIPDLPGPEPVPAGTAEKRADDDERDPQNVEADKETQDLEPSLAQRVVAVALRIDVEIRNQHQSHDDETRQHHARIPRVEEHQHFLQAQEVPRRLRRIRRAGRIRRLLERRVEQQRPYRQHYDDEQRHQKFIAHEERPGVQLLLDAAARLLDRYFDALRSAAARWRRRPRPCARARTGRAHHDAAILTFRACHD